MKKSLLILALLIMTAFTACQTAKTPEPSSEPTTAANSQTPPESPKPPKTPKIVINSPLAKIGDIEYSEPKIIDPLIILKDQIKDVSPSDFNTSLSYLFYFYEAGKIKIDPYKDWSLLVLSKRCDGPCSAVIYRFAWNPQTNKLVNLVNHSYQPTEEDYTYMEEEMKFLLKEKDAKTVFKSLELPTTISIPDTSEVIELAAKDIDLTYQKYADGADEQEIIFSLGKIAFTDAILGNIYLNENVSCLYSILPDGTIQRYSFNPKFFEKSNNNMATLIDGDKKLNLKKDFHYFEQGCGVTAGCYYILNNVNEDNLKPVATTENKLKLYSIKEVAQVNGVKASSDEQITMENIYQIRGAIETFQAFADKNQVLFWKDPFGRYSYIAHNDVTSAAECGKPVIYLYPEKETDVKVSVGIDKITASIPEHGRDGWSVRAYPNGKIHNYADSLEYPYLFWEGTDKEQIPVTKGFVIARENVPTFLDESLTKLGLSKTEEKDFMEFWKSRILENPQPYFYFSFLGTKEFNKIAPLTISPKPDTLLRVFMYYNPLNKAIEVAPQTLRSIPRKGFTVVEWGGTSNTRFTK